MAMKKILYIGKEDAYIDSIEDQIHSSIQVEKYDHQGNIAAALKKILISSPSLLILDFPGHFAVLNKLIGLVRLNWPHKKIPILCFTPENAQKELHQLSLVGSVIYFIKSIDQDDAVFCISTLLSPELNFSENVSKAIFQEQTHFSDIVWINNLSVSHYTFETNRIFKSGDEVKLNLPFFSHPLRLLMHKITTEKSKTVQSSFNYSYRLDYLFSYDQLRPEDRTKLLMDFKYTIEKLPIKEFVYEWIQEFYKKPKKIVLASDKDHDFDFDTSFQQVAPSVKNLEISSKTVIFNWIYEQAKGKPLTKDSITIYQDNFGLLESGTPLLERENTVIHFRQMILQAEEEVLKDRPSVIAILVDEVNSLEKVFQLILGAIKLKDYFPFVILFNFPSDNVEEIRSKLQYHFVITTKLDVSETIILKMLELYRKKKLEKDLKKIVKFLDSMKLLELDIGIFSEQLFYDYRAFTKAEGKESYLYVGLSVEIKWMSEFEVVFLSEQEIQVGEVFLWEFPFPLHVVIVPYEKKTNEPVQKNLYKGLIHFMNEIDKKILRRFINHITSLASTRKKPFSHQEITALKKQFFTK